MVAAAILDFQAKWIGHIHVNSVVLELCTKFGSTIRYSHWDQRPSMGGQNSQNSNFSNQLIFS